ncbi:MAG TPA: citrate synthase [Polyangiaceae bacterium]|nr:citrate synthase [Polyangiaceae bacterium]
MSSAEGEWLGAKEASALLGVRRETLYAYASRGLVRVRRVGSARVYARADLEALRARSQARRGHAAVAAGALRFGEPVLDTRVSSIGADGPRYRGRSAVELAQQDVSAERVAELLWTEVLPEHEPVWPRAEKVELDALRERQRVELSPAGAMLLVLANTPHDEGAASRSREDELDSARRLLRLVAAAPALGLPPRWLDKALSARTLAAALLSSLAKRSSEPAEAALNQALTLIADHELNASTFVARVAASAGADMPRSLAAAFATLTGARHGGVCDRLDTVLDGFSRPEQAIAWVRAELAQRRAVPGFGHPLYASGDPRAAPLLRASLELGADVPRVRAVHVAIDAMALAGGEPATVDLGLVAIAAALGLRSGSAAAIFALGRALGYVAHVLEQREQGFLLRPRAHYVGI